MTGRLIILILSFCHIFAVTSLDRARCAGAMHGRNHNDVYERVRDRGRWLRDTLARSTSTRKGHAGYLLQTRTSLYVRHAQLPTADSCNMMNGLARSVKQRAPLTLQRCSCCPIFGIELSQLVGLESAHAVFTHCVNTRRAFSRMCTTRRETRSEVCHAPSARGAASILLAITSVTKCSELVRPQPFHSPTCLVKGFPWKAP